VGVLRPCLVPMNAQQKVWGVIGYSFELS